MARRISGSRDTSADSDAMTAQIRAELARAGLLPSASPPPRPDGVRLPGAKDGPPSQRLAPGTLSVARFLAAYLVPMLFLVLVGLIVSLR